MYNKTLKNNIKKNNTINKFKNSITNKTLKIKRKGDNGKGTLTTWQCFLKKNVPKMKGNRVERIKHASKAWRALSEKEKTKYINCENKLEELNKLINRLDDEINHETSIPELDYTETTPDLDALVITLKKCNIVSNIKSYHKVSNFNVFMDKFNHAQNIVDTHRMNKDISISNINSELQNEDQTPEQLNKIKSQAMMNNLNSHLVGMLKIRETQLKDLRNKILKHQNFDKISISELAFEYKKLKKYMNTIKTSQKDLAKSVLFHELEKILDDMQNLKEHNKDTTKQNKSKQLRTITHKLKLIKD
jgi:hypothetical protein